MEQAVTVTGLQLLNAAKTHHPFTTGHHRLDTVLTTHPPPPTTTTTPAGLARRQLLQIDGPPGSGKSSLLLGTAIRARATSLLTPSSTRDLVQVLLIDADGSLHPALIRRAVDSLVQKTLPNPDQNLVDHICDGLHLVRITSTAELGLFLRNLNKWLTAHPQVKLVMLDSITAHTRYVSMSINHRNTIAKIIRDSLTNASSVHDCTVIVTSQLTTKSSNNHHLPNQPTSSNSSSPLSYANNKVLVPPDFRTYQWYHSYTSSSSSVVNTHHHPNKKLKTSSSNSTCKIWKLSLMFTFDGQRVVKVLQNDRLVEPKSGFLFDINEIGIFDPSVKN